MRWATTKLASLGLSEGPGPVWGFSVACKEVEISWLRDVGLGFFKPAGLRHHGVSGPRGFEIVSGESFLSWQSGLTSGEASDFSQGPRISNLRAERSGAADNCEQTLVWCAKISSQ